mmetsp:Transcript_11739/g.16144  ORF Transcript_11739/g.16144 Transcript_11739/m.16144 type:complete len:206 (-) Transcript_11739:518-1135(-)
MLVMSNGILLRLSGTDSPLDESLDVRLAFDGGVSTSPSFCGSLLSASPLSPPPSLLPRSSSSPSFASAGSSSPEAASCIIAAKEASTSSRPRSARSTSSNVSSLLPATVSISSSRTVLSLILKTFVAEESNGEGVFSSSSRYECKSGNPVSVMSLKETKWSLMLRKSNSVVSSDSLSESLERSKSFSNTNALPKIALRSRNRNII